MLPPIVDHGELAGSGGYQSPCSAAATRSSSLITPAWTTASRSSGSIERISLSRSSAMITPPSMALAPPESPVPAPRAVTGTPNLAHTRTADATSSLEIARINASGSPTGAHSASSWLRLSVMSRPTISASDGRAAASAARTSALSMTVFFQSRRALLWRGWLCPTEHRDDHDACWCSGGGQDDQECTYSQIGRQD